jgi:hypothetical protein
MCSVEHALSEIKTSKPGMYEQICQALTQNVRVIVETNNLDSICQVQVVHNQPRWSRNGVKGMTYTTGREYRFYYLVADPKARSLLESEASIPSESDLHLVFQDFLKEGQYEADNLCISRIDYLILKLFPRLSIRQHFNQMLEVCLKFISTAQMSLSWDDAFSGQTYYAKYGDFMTRCGLLAKTMYEILIVDYMPNIPLDTYIKTTEAYWQIKPTHRLHYDEEDRSWTLSLREDGTYVSRFLQLRQLDSMDNWMKKSYDETFMETETLWIAPPKRHLTMDGSLPLIEFNGLPLLVTTEFFHSREAARRWLQQQIKLYYRPPIPSLGIPAAAEEFRYRPGSNLRDFNPLTRTAFGLTSFDYTK